jgi:glutamate racemase
MWVPLIENNEHHSSGADYFVEKHMKEIFSHSPDIDTILLACTHYPLLKDKIQQYMPETVTLISQGEIVAKSLVNYLQRHQEIERRCSKNSNYRFYTTDSITDFENHATTFFGQTIHAEQVHL